MAGKNGATSRFLSREAILTASDLETEAVFVPEWNGDVLVRSLSAFERDEFEQSMIEGQGADRRTNMSNMRAKLVALTCVDEDGKLLFTRDDAYLLGQHSAGAIMRVWDVAQRLSGMSRRDVEAIAGNSSTTATDDSTID